MNTKIGILFLALLIGMAGIVMPSMAGKDKPTDPVEDYWIPCAECGGIDVYNKDIGGIPDGGWEEWKTTNTDCESPQCELNSEGLNELVDPIANPSVDFSKYHAQQDCGEIRGRLPTKDELTQIYNNRVSLGNNFAHLYY